MAEQRVSEVEYRSTKSVQSGEHRGKILKKNEHSLGGTIEMIKW